MIRMIRFLFIMAMVPTSVSAQNAYAIKEATASSFTSNSLAAMGSAASTTTDSQATGTLTLYDPGGATNSVIPVVLKTRGTQKVRIELQRASGTTKRILNQGVAAILKPDGTVARQLLINNTLGERVSHVPGLSLLAEYQTDSVSVEGLGQATVNGSTSDSIVLSVIPASDAASAAVYKDMTRTVFFIDRASSRVTKMSYDLEAEATTSEKSHVEVYFSDYRNIGGVWVPFSQTTYTDGVVESQLTLQSINFNVGLPDTEFTLP